MAVDPVTALINRIYAGQGRVKNFDPQLAASINTARTNLADINRSYNRGVLEAQVNYDETARNLLKQRDQAYDTNSNQFAGQGILRSGIFATEQGKVGEAYQNDLTGAANAKRAARENLISQRLSGYNQTTAALRNAQAAATARAAERRMKQAQDRIQAEFQKRQQFMALVAQNQQRQLLQQQLALSRQSIGGGGGGGGGGGYYDLASLFPGLLGSKQKQKSKFNNRGSGKQVIKKGGRVVGHTPPA